ncbi:nucleotidyltransferase domain-containing protein [Promethearchaeum syntrophicum]|uniref:Nucleotidyltransferase domain-containing protein n=1 Tax=Promethearchaeum syntrophicum TaxID=2594042 RepID=A0A5B9D9H1_9ARCH|nr:nucleotidyltransferase domain-containing protein [Candidatus Prometheoarchaeum syntrophicum]QEE15839.1 hypothetical protein DSAG12_01666 [Candidatus Prometheoarchaeum syntrophicum]
MSSLLELAEEIASTLSKSIAEIELIVVYGSVARDSSSQYSDLDMITLFDSEADKEQFKSQVNLNFMFQEHPVDAWASSFEKLEKTTTEIKSSMWLYQISGLLDCKILYSRGEKCTNRFTKFQQKIRKIISDHKNNVALIKKDYHPWSIFYHLKQSIKINDRVSGRYGIWELIFNIITVYARLNDTYLTKNWGSNMHEAFQFSKLPKHFPEKVETLLVSQDWNQILTVCEELSERTQKDIENAYIETLDPPVHDIKEEFLGFLEYLNKIRAACKKQDLMTASYAASELQLWIGDRLSYLDNPQKYFGEYLPFSKTQTHYFSKGFPDLLPLICALNWSETLNKCDELEQKIHLILHQLGTPLNVAQNIGEIPYFFKTK